MIELSHHIHKPMAIRYPKSLPASDIEKKIEIGKWERIHHGRDVLLIAAGRMVDIALEARSLLLEKMVSTGVVNARFIRPMDETMLRDISKMNVTVIVLEDGIVSGGMGEEIMRKMQSYGFTGKTCLIGAPDAFVAHGSVSEQTKDNHMDALSVSVCALKAIGKEPE